MVVGDTAGHTYPALAVAEAIRRRRRDADILLLAVEGSTGADLVRREGHATTPIPGAPIRRQGAGGILKAVCESARAFHAARSHLRRQRVQVVIGFGGFASGAVALAGRSLGLPAIVHEANVDLGLSNRWLRPWASLFLRGLTPTEGEVDAGVPVRSTVASLMTWPRDAEPGVLRLLVVSGSRGEDFLAARLPAVVARLVAAGIAVSVRRQSTGDVTSDQALEQAGARVSSAPFIGDIAGAYMWANAAVARAGASTIAELAIAGLPSLLVPLADAAADHQTANARLWAAAGAGHVVSERDWDSDAVARWLLTMVQSPAEWSAASQAARRLARPDAADRVAVACLHLAGRGA